MYTKQNHKEGNILNETNDQDLAILLQEEQLELHICCSIYRIGVPLNMFNMKHFLKSIFACGDKHEPITKACWHQKRPSEAAMSFWQIQKSQYEYC